MDKPACPEQAVIVHMHMQKFDQAELLEEFIALVHSANVNPVATLTGSRKEPHPRWFIGSGKLAELQAALAETQADVVLFNHQLTATQVRNLEMDLHCRVVDRVGLILDIFAQRARSYEGQLQVELAQLNYLSTRLRGFGHFDQQKGGIGLRGPGESKLETDKRLLRKRVDRLQDKLIKVRQQRAQGRAARLKADIPQVALVGYTNAGKSTLFNRLTQAATYAADQLFATLDTTTRRVRLPSLGQVVVSDTVGFIRHLPISLIEAFNATLEEVAQADLLLHVIDASHPECDDQIYQVQQVLAALGADQLPCVLVYNKIDQLSQQHLAKLQADFAQQGVRKAAGLLVSAQQGKGIQELLACMVSQLAKTIQRFHIMIPPRLDSFRAFLYAQGAMIQHWQSLTELPMHAGLHLYRISEQVAPATGNPAEQNLGEIFYIACEPVQWQRWLSRAGLRSDVMKII